MAHRAAPNHAHPVQADHRMLHLLYNTIPFSLLKIRGWSPLKESARMPLFLRGISLYLRSQRGIRQHHQLLPTAIQHRPHPCLNLDTHLHPRTHSKVCQPTAQLLLINCRKQHHLFPINLGHRALLPILRERKIRNHMDHIQRRPALTAEVARLVTSQILEQVTSHLLVK